MLASSVPYVRCCNKTFKLNHIKFSLSTLEMFSFFFRVEPEVYIVTPFSFAWWEWSNCFGKCDYGKKIWKGVEEDKQG